MGMEKALIEAGEDFEWYPTTDEIIEKAAADAKRLLDGVGSVLDVGAGDGRVLRGFAEALDEEIRMLAIEKSTINLSRMPREVIPVGTDFFAATLIDKKADVVFCNPPYSQFEIWAERIVREAHAAVVYLVLPVRWEASERIAAALARRKARTGILGEYDFENAERRARAKVHLIRVELARRSTWYDRRSGEYGEEEGLDWGRRKEPRVDPFDLWFDEAFPAAEAAREEEEPAEEEAPGGDALTRGENLIERLVRLYDADMERLMENYRKIASLDPGLLEELGVSRQGLAEGVKEKVAGLKHEYWRRLFESLEKITDRLTSRYRERMLEKLRDRSDVDFTRDNAYAVVIWAVKNANAYFDDQIVDFFTDLFNEESVKGYKSTRKAFMDAWRHEKSTGWGRPDGKEWARKGWRWYLDYRIVHGGWHGFAISSEWDARLGLGRRGREWLGDVLTVAGLLGFDAHRDPMEEEWEAGKAKRFYLKRNHLARPLKVGTATTLGRVDEVFVDAELGLVQYRIGDNWYHGDFVRAKSDVLMEVRAFKKGTFHVKFAQPFIRALNVKAAQILGWVRAPGEAAEEMEISEREAAEAMGISYRIEPKKAVAMLAA